MRFPGSVSFSLTVRRMIAACVVLSSVGAGPALAGVNTWTTHGPEGGAIGAVAVDPNTPTIAYAATEGGAFKTTDGGNSWKAINNGLPGPAVNTFAFDPTNSEIVYAGTSGGLFKSIDGGGAWSSLNQESSNAGIKNDSSVTAVAIDPVSNAIYAAAAGTFGGIFKSTDGGQSWHDIGGPLLHTGSYYGVVDFVFDPRDHRVIYLATDRLVLKTTDGGGMWTALPVGGVNGLVIDRGSPETLYAATRLGISKTADGGKSWQPSNSGLAVDILGIGFPDTPEVLALAISEDGLATLYAGTVLGGVFKSTDGAVSWTTVNSGLPIIPNSTVTDSFEALAIGQSDGNTLYAVSGGPHSHIFKTTNGGDSWNIASTGVTATSVKALAVAEETPRTVYAGVTLNGGMFKTTNKGSTWNEANNGFANGLKFGLNSTYSATAIAVNPKTPSTLYAGTAEKGVLKSTDGGATWNPARTGMEAFGTGIISTLAIDPFNPTTVYAGTYAGLFKSTDAAATWHPVAEISSTVPVNTIAVDPVRKDTIYVGTSEGRVYRSDDGDGLMVVLTVPFGEPYALAIDATTTPSTIYVGTTPNDGIFKSTDGGDTWMPINTGLVAAVLPSGDVPWSIHALAIDPTNPDVVYAGTEFGGVFRTTDGGENWAAFNESSADVLFSGMSITALAIDPGPPETVYAGTDWDGVFALSEGASMCVGDCQGTGSVNISALITLVNIALGGSDLSACPNGIPSGATVNIAMLIQAVNNALGGCPA